MSELTAERAHELLNYDPLTGIFTWRLSRGVVSQGDVAGTTNGNGYVAIGCDNKIYKAHRLAWLMTYGLWPPEHIDHINGDPGDNRITNIRAVSNALNQQNRRRPRSDSATRYLGVSLHSRRKYFLATICIQGKSRHLGCFTDPAEAHQAYLNAKRQLHAGCTL